LETWKRVIFVIFVCMFVCHAHSLTVEMLYEVHMLWTVYNIQV